MKRIGLLVTALACVALAAPAGAQDSRLDLGVGYSMVPADDVTLHGWQASIGWPLSSRVAIVADLSGHYGSLDGTDVSDFMAMAGPRLSLLGGNRVSPFVHVLAGIVRSKASVSVFEVDIAESSTEFGGVAGGGLDIRMGDSWGLRLQGDMRVVKVEDETATDPRIGAGVVFRFGK
ncbi:MAG TPA: outer membrane beta-barrel protein [Vicinamibacteria bacterium]|nr:outer membrane beta-barrel protein [Vicinamibacteria bacterium]